jgi:hypothetical protein
MTDLPPPPLDEDVRGRFETAFYGLMAYRELTAFERLSSDARFSPTLRDRDALGRLAVAEFQHYELLVERLTALGVDPQEAMRPFTAAIDAVHERTRPGDWHESLMKAYVFDAVSGDFYRAGAEALDGDVREAVETVQTSEDQTAWVRERLREAIAEDPPLASRLALWGRRLVGEALTQARRIGDEHGFWRHLLGSPAGAERDAQVTALMARLVERHSRRMGELGLTA